MSYYGKVAKIAPHSTRWSGGTYCSLAAAAAADAELPVTCLGFAAVGGGRLCHNLVESSESPAAESSQMVPMLPRLANTVRRSVAIVKTETARKRKFGYSTPLLSWVSTIEMQQDDLPTYVSIVKKPMVVLSTRDR
jgi:hypothetical protein